MTYDAPMSADQSSGKEVEFKVPVGDEGDFVALAESLGASLEGARTALQENHFFDTASGDLRAAGYSLRLRFEGDRRILTAKGAAAESDGALKIRPEEEAEVDGADAERILAGALSPLEALIHALAPERAALVDRIEEELGDGKLVHVGSFRNVRRYLGPVDVAGTDVTFELDRTELPGGRIDHEFEVEVDEAVLDRFEPALRELVDALGAQWTSVPSKLRRFYEALETNDASDD